MWGEEIEKTLVPAQNATEYRRSSCGNTQSRVAWKQGVVRSPGTRKTPASVRMRRCAGVCCERLFCADADATCSCRFVDRTVRSARVLLSGARDAVRVVRHCAPGGNAGRTVAVREATGMIARWRVLTLPTNSRALDQGFYRTARHRSHVELVVLRATSCSTHH